MRRFLRFSIIGLLAVFAASSVVQAAGASAMSVEMAFPDGGTMAMADCETCSSGDRDDRTDVVCDVVCVPPFAAHLGGHEATISPVAAAHTLGSADRFVGRIGGPEPNPPRFLIWN